MLRLRESKVLSFMFPQGVNFEKSTDLGLAVSTVFHRHWTRQCWRGDVATIFQDTWCCLKTPCWTLQGMACSSQEMQQGLEHGLPAGFFLVTYSWRMLPVLLNLLCLHVTKRYCLPMAQDTMLCLSVIDTLADWTSVKILGFIQNSMKLIGIFS